MDQPLLSGNPQLSAHIDHNRFVGRTRVAYFSMEIAIAPEMPTYSGGLGILTGDTARAAADLNLPIVFVTLISRGRLSPAGTTEVLLQLGRLSVHLRTASNRYRTRSTLSAR